jgi:hypothetical protein
MILTAFAEKKILLVALEVARQMLYVALKPCPWSFCLDYFSDGVSLHAEVVLDCNPPHYAS